MVYFMSRDEVLGLTGLSSSSLYRMMDAGDFPVRRRIGPNRVGWLSTEVLDWVETRPTVEPGELVPRCVAAKQDQA